MENVFFFQKLLKSVILSTYLEKFQLGLIEYYPLINKIPGWFNENWGACPDKLVLLSTSY